MVWMFSIKIISALNQTVLPEEVKLNVSSSLPTVQFPQSTAVTKDLKTPMGVKANQMHKKFTGTLKVSRYLLSASMCIPASSLSNDITDVLRNALVTLLL